MNLFKSFAKSTSSKTQRDTTLSDQKPKGLFSLFCGCTDRNDAKQTESVLKNEIKLKKESKLKSTKEIALKNYDLSE